MEQPTASPSTSRERGAPSLERERLVRYCARFTGDPAAAEDLAQQTLIEAWRRERELRDERARWGWLYGIARNLCLMWARARSRETSRFARPRDGSGNPIELAERIADDSDLDLELERDDLARLLDRAMALLPPATRAVLVERYIEESSQADIARRLGLTEGAVEARLHRGKVSLHRVLTTHFRDEVASYGLTAPADDGWRETRIWCPGCGRHRLMGHLEPQVGRLRLSCPGCCRAAGGFGCDTWQPELRGGVTGFKPALSRVLVAGDQYWRGALTAGAAPCMGCGRSNPVGMGSPGYIEPWRRTPHAVHAACASCGSVVDYSLLALALSTPEARRFWRDNPRVRALPERAVEADGIPALVVHFESVVENAGLDVVCARDSLRVIHVQGPAGR